MRKKKMRGSVSVKAADEEILKSVVDDVTGAWGLLLGFSARKSEDLDAKEMFQEASNYLDVLDFDKLNKKAIPGMTSLDG